MADLETIAVCCRILGALFYLSPDDPSVVPILEFLKNEGLVKNWTLNSPQELEEIDNDMVLRLSSNVEIQDLAHEYQRLFIGPDHLEAPPWGSIYLEEEGTIFGNTTWALREFLRSEGVILSTERREPDDHIGLLFLAAAYLAEKNKIIALRKLLENHILPWSSIYLKQLKAASQNSFYRGLATLASATLESMKMQLTR